MDETRKIFTELTERAYCYSKKLQGLCQPEELDYLNETIVDILENLDAGSTEIFFDLTAKLVEKHASGIQEKLNRHIPLGVFITDIYCLLRRMCEERKKRIDTLLDEFNTAPGLDCLQNEFREMYNYVLSDLKLVKCKSCTGEYYA